MMNEKSPSRLKRPIYPMPNFVHQALEESVLTAAYCSRPPYQQNDYVGWITRAKLKSTQQKRLAQMLDELQSGDSYMGMVYRAKPYAQP